ncbi:hypothetical protein McaMca56_000548 [Microsporum canis]
MCKRSYNKIIFGCSHVLETPGSLVPNGCGSCGIEKGINDNIASLTKRDPCDDCQAKGLWARTPGGKWYEVAEGGPKKFAPGFKYPSPNNQLSATTHKLLPCAFTELLHAYETAIIDVAIFAMGFYETDALHKHNYVGGGGSAYVYHVSPMIVVKTVRPDRDFKEEEEIGHPLHGDIAFYERFNTRQDRCPHIVECFLMFPDYLFLSFCPNKAFIHYYLEHCQEREDDRLFGRFIRVKEYQDPALIARWIQQLTSALEYVEKMGYCHNDLNSMNCLLDERLNLKLSDFGRASTIGQYLECSMAPWALKLSAGPLAGTHGLCSARTEQFAVGSFLYFLVYGYNPYDDINLEGPELERRFKVMDFPELNRHEIFDELISACWYNVYPTMYMVAYDFKRKTKDIGTMPEEYEIIDRTKGRKTSEALVRRGLLGPKLALRFQPLWWRYLHAAKKPDFEYSDRCWAEEIDRTFSAAPMGYTVGIDLGGAEKGFQTRQMLGT